jgi:FMN-dependent oxidoreductase (nitrilotriacetate monooxygenase family)
VAGQGGRGTLEPLTLLAALAASTERIGLIATASTTYTEPYNLARTFASLDHLSRGRVGWNIVTSSSADAAANFGADEVPHDRRYQRADEFLEVVTQLWDSWEDDARVLDKATGVALAADRVHTIGYVGQELRVRGPLNVPRPPQGQPVLVQAGSSPAGRTFAARWAEVVFTAAQTLPDAQGFYADIRARVAAIGREPDLVKVLPGISPFLGSTEVEARGFQDQLDEIAVPTDTVDTQVWPQLGGLDLSRYAMDAPVPLHLLPDAEQVQGNRSRFSLIVNLAQREHLTLRQLLRRLAGARGHLTVAGTPVQVADLMQQWHTHRAADGFNVMPPLFPDQFDAFVDEVVPILRQRGLFRPRYPGSTLREYYGLPRPANRHAQPAWSQPAVR